MASGVCRAWDNGVIKLSQSPEQRRITQLEREVAKLNQQIAVKDSCLDLQKKALDMLEQWNNAQ